TRFGSAGVGVATSHGSELIASTQAWPAVQVGSGWIWPSRCQFSPKSELVDTPIQLGFATNGPGGPKTPVKSLYPTTTVPPANARLGSNWASRPGGPPSGSETFVSGPAGAMVPQPQATAPYAAISPTRVRSMLDLQEARGSGKEKAPRDDPHSQE